MLSASRSSCAQSYHDYTTVLTTVRCIENNDHTLVNSLHGLLNCEIGGLDCRVITTEYISSVHCPHT